MSCFESFVFFGINWMGKRSAAAVAVAVAKKTETEMVALPDWLISSNSSPSTFEQTILEEPLQRVMLCVSVQTCCSSWRTENVFVCAFVDEIEGESGKRDSFKIRNI